jgi:hypothetical protein
VCLDDLRSVVDHGDPSAWSAAALHSSHAARCPWAPPAEQLADRVQIPDQPGELATVTALATELDINVYDVEVAHSVDERGGRLLLVVDAARAGELVAALGVRGRVASAHEL